MSNDVNMQSDKVCHSLGIKHVMILHDNKIV